MPNRLSCRLDNFIEATVVLSYTKFGILLRRKLLHFEEPASCEGRTVLITGATSGLGKAAAVMLANKGAAVHLVGRDEQRVHEVVEEIAEKATGKVFGHVADLSDMDSVRALAAELLGQEISIDSLIHNAGALSRHYQLAVGGVELTGATQLLGPYLLTQLLLPAFRDAAARVVIVTSAGGFTEKFDLAKLDPTPLSYNGVRQYAQVKRAQIVLCAAWNERLPLNISAFSTHPGWANTPGLQKGLPKFAQLLRPVLRTPEQGADTMVFLAAGGTDEHCGPLAVKDHPSHGVWFDRRERRSDRLSKTQVSAEQAARDGAQLWKWCEEHTASTTST